jgi:hypothetical protein
MGRGYKGIISTSISNVELCYLSYALKAFLEKEKGVPGGEDIPRSYNQGMSQRSTMTKII